MQWGGAITLVSNETGHDLSTIGGRLKWARVTRTDLSQEELADRAGVSQGTIGNIESGARKNPRELLAIARAANVSAEWLKSGKGLPGPVTYQSPANEADSVISAREPSSSTYLVGSILKDTKTLPEVVQRGEVMQLLAAGELPQEFCLVLEDDSMSPTHPPGTEIQFLRVRKLEEVRDVKDVVLAQVGNALLARHFRRLVGEQFELKPFNPIYPEFTSEKVSIQIIAVGKRFTHGPAE